MKYLIAGLGNIGTGYEGTRHNIGFAVVDHIAARKGVEFEQTQLAWKATVRHKGRTFHLIKPTTYMNRSGKAVRYWLQKEKVAPGHLLVIVDDLNLPFGKIRLRGKGSHGGHNGLEDVIRHLGHQSFARMRIGIGNEFNRGRQVDHVLGEWSEEESRNLPGIVEKAAKGVFDFGFIGIGRTMNWING